MEFQKNVLAHNRFTKMSIPAMLLLGLTLVMYQVGQEVTLSAAAIVILIIVYAVLIILAVRGYYEKDIFYDDANLYLKGPRDTLIVPFCNVQRVKRILSRARIVGFTFFEYKIEYVDDQNNLAETHFWDFISSNSIDEFASVVKKINNNFIVDHSASSGDR